MTNDDAPPEPYHRRYRDPDGDYCMNERHVLFGGADERLARLEDRGRAFMEQQFQENFDPWDICEVGRKIAYHMTMEACELACNRRGWAASVETLQKGSDFAGQTAAFFEQAHRTLQALADDAAAERDGHQANPAGYFRAEDLTERSH
jgi:hypothetical protein